MTDIRNLCLAIQRKLEERRKLLSRNRSLNSDLRRERQKNELLTKTLGNPMVQLELEDCADEIARAILDEAVKASRAVASEAVGGGEYVIGISVPSFHIRRRVAWVEMAQAGDMEFQSRPIKRVEI